MAASPPDYGARVRGAIVAAAVGDALGWPQETRSNIVGGQKARNIRPEPQFRKWDRNSGGQYARYRETIEAGEYSDDTQLLIAVARSCFAGPDWLHWLTNVELPAWTLYQRGAGRAVIAAGRCWAQGHPPWISGQASLNRRGVDQVAGYFNAGANGVAMRIAPHAIVSINESTSSLLRRVVADGITTHGHARALVGGVLHALAMRYALSLHGTLEYGDLLVALMDEQSWQAPDWLTGVLPANWLKSYMATTSRPIEAAWDETVTETIELLQIARKSLSRAALANDEETLGALGCYDKSRNGAGTVTAVAAAYIAARTAARPMTGLLRAAFLPRADTDTLASMTASLLGAIHGTGWLGLLADTVQDSPYLHELSLSLAEASSRRDLSHPSGLFAHAAVPAVRKPGSKELDRFRHQLFHTGQGAPEVFVDGRLIVELDRSPLRASGAVSVTRARLRTSDGQLLIIDNLSRTRPMATPSSSPRSSTDIDIDTTQTSGQHPLADVTEIALRVANIRRSLHVYHDILKLPVGQERDGSVRLTPGLRLTELRERGSVPADGNHRGSVRITIRVEDFHGVVQRARSSTLVDVMGFDERPGFEQLRILDPDGYYLMVVPS